MTGTGVAQDYIDLARQLHQEGFEDRATIHVDGDELQVEVTGTAGRTERIYSRDGSRLLEEETVTSDGTKLEREYDSAGRVVEEEIVRADGFKIEREYDAAGDVVEEEIKLPGEMAGRGREKRNARAELRGDNRSERGAERSAGRGGPDDNRDEDRGGRDNDRRGHANDRGGRDNDRGRG